MVAAFDYCLHGKGGAAPSIDTAMHGLVDAAHVDHLHPDSGIAIATAEDGEALTRKIFGDKVVWVPWRRPGFQLGLDIAAIKADNPRAVGCILGGHGITAWGETVGEVPSATRCGSCAPPSATSRSTRSPRPFGAVAEEVGAAVTGGAAYASGRAGAAAAWRRLARPADGRSLHRRPASCSTSWLAATTRGWRSSAPAARTTSCGPRSSRWCSTSRLARRWRR